MIIFVLISTTKTRILSIFSSKIMKNYCWHFFFSVSHTSFIFKSKNQSIFKRTRLLMSFNEIFSNEKTNSYRNSPCSTCHELPHPWLSHMLPPLLNFFPAYKFCLKHYVCEIYTEGYLLKIIKPHFNTRITNSQLNRSTFWYLQQHFKFVMSLWLVIRI